MRRNLKGGGGKYEGEKKKILRFLFISKFSPRDRLFVGYPFLPNSIPSYDVGAIRMIVAVLKETRKKKKKKEKRAVKRKMEKKPGEKRKESENRHAGLHEFTCSLYTLGSDLFWI